MTDITRKRGDTHADEFTVISDKNATVIDITGHTFLLTVDPEEKPSDAVNNIFQLTGTIVDAAAGIVSFAPSAAQSNNVGEFFYDIQMTDVGSKIRTIQAGRYSMGQDITK